MPQSVLPIHVVLSLGYAVVVTDNPTMDIVKSEWTFREKHPRPLTVSYRSLVVQHRTVDPSNFSLDASLRPPHSRWIFPRRNGEEDEPMQSHSHQHHSLFGANWSAENIALAILVPLLFIIFLFLFMTLIAPPAQGQILSPANAQQAAPPPVAGTPARWNGTVSPSISSRLQPGGRPMASYRSRKDALAHNRRGWLPDDNVIYENGPIDGNTLGWVINFGFAVADSFTVQTTSNITGMSFGAWLFPGDVLQSVEVSITSAPFGGTAYFDHTLSVIQSGCESNGGFNVCTETATLSVTLNAGTYWLELRNGFVNTGDPVYWDQNSGVGCHSQDCPSQAVESSVGTIPSESFSIAGYSTGPPPPPPCFQAQGNLQIVHDFTTQEGSPSGVVTDRAGNVYGSVGNGGDSGYGLIFKLAPWLDWLFEPLYKLFLRRRGPSRFDFLGYTFGRCYSIRRGRVFLGTVPSKNECNAYVGSLPMKPDAIRTGWTARQWWKSSTG